MAVRISFVDKPDQSRKFQEKPMPLLGGIAVFCSLAVVVCAEYKLGLFDSRDHADAPNFKTMFLLSGFFFCLLGLMDDRWPMRPRRKLLGQILASLPFAIWASSITSIVIMGIQLPLGIFRLIFTVLWIVTCSNVVNLLDGLDGLASGIGIIAAITMAVLCILTGSHEAGAVAFFLSASLAGFLIHNWPPASIYLGDSGSLMIGGLLGCLSLQTTVKTATSFTFIIPMLVMSIPLFDTVMAIVRRKLSGRSIAHADRGHIHHRLQQCGLSRRETLFWIFGMSSAMGVVAILATVLKSEMLGLYVAAMVAAFMIIGKVFGHHEARLVCNHGQALLHLLLDTWNVLKTRVRVTQLMHAEDVTEDEIWNLMIDKIQRIAGTQLTLTCRSSDQRAPRILKVWNTSIFPMKSLQDRHWRCEYACQREGGFVLEIIAGGQSPSTASGRRTDDLFRLFEACCLTWSLSSLAEDAADVRENPVLSLHGTRRTAA